MVKVKRSRFVFLVLSLFLVLCVGVPGAMAVPPPSDESSSGTIGVQSTLYLASGSSYITNNYDGTVSVLGKSEAVQIVDQIWVKVYLQQWNGSQWVDVTSGLRKDAYNTYYVSKGAVYSVPGGYYYRTKSQHQVIHNGIYDPSPPAVSYSGYIWVP
jgi:hypothetical protein